MTVFIHIASATRFTDGSEYGAYYGAKDLGTTFAENMYHREWFLSATNWPDTELTMRCYINKVATELHDIRDNEFSHLSTNDYAVAQQFAKELKMNGSNRSIYKSVREKGWECVAAFKPKADTIPIQGCDYKYSWSGKKK